MPRDDSTPRRRQKREPLASGQTVGRWSLIREVEKTPSGHRRWLCRCECGTERVVLQGNLRPRQKRGLMCLSCGCWRDEVLSRAARTHGHTAGGERSGEYIIWMGIRARCTNENGSGFDRYGARGITVCDRWRDSFEAFLEDMGPRPSPDHQVDRFPDNHGDYEPGNCRWASRSENQNNRDCNVRIEHDGKNLTVAEWSEITGIKWTTIRERLKRGWSAADTLTKPIDRRCYRKARDGSR